MIETGTILQNRYRVEKQIGQGGMGNVYVATDERFKSVVAIKETVFEDANLRRAFEREALLLNSLKHPALPRVSDHFGENNGQFLVMEFIAGDDLAAMMEKNGEAFPLETVLNWSRQLCDALEYLHAQDIIHRDIKPQNLKLTPNGQIFLLDFGLAKGNATDSAHQTAAKSIFGFSRNYASLEQIQGAGTEPRSDLYSLAATLYHLLTGIPPADALTRAMNVLNGKSDPLIAANLINRNVPAGVADVLQKTMALNADERPTSAYEMRRLLDESDKTVDLFAANAVGGNLLNADFLTQETKIIGAKTNVNVGVDSEGATKIETKNSLDGKFNQATDENFQSRATVLRPIAATQPPKRSKAVGAVVLGGILLIGSGLSAGYFLTSDSPRSSVVSENTNTENSNTVSLAESTNAAAINSNISNSDLISAEKETTQKTSPAPTSETTNVAKETKKQTQNPPSTAKKSQPNNADDKIVVNDETIEMGDVIIDDNGIRDKKTGKSLIPNVSSDQSNPLTLEQIQQLRQLRKFEQLNRRLENRKRNIIIKTPRPPKPPVTAPTP